MNPRSADFRVLVAHVLPFALFMAGIALTEAMHCYGGGASSFLLVHSEQWIYPLQTLVCAVALVAGWRYYQFGSQKTLPLAIGVGIVVFGIWVSPQWLFHQPARVTGFDPTIFAATPTVYWSVLAARFLRLVIVVPLLEEIFWRGFLQRYLVKESFLSVPFGTYTPLSFWGVAVAFMLVHLMPDWPAALITAAAYGWLAVRSKSLLTCVVAHATTNLLLGIYIVTTKQWGFW